MKGTFLIGLFTLAAGSAAAVSAFAQTDDTPPAPDAAAPEQAREAPAQAETPPPPAEPEAGAQPQATPRPDAGEPANLCQELLSFMQAPPPQEAAAQPEQAQQQSGSGQEEQQAANGGGENGAGENGSGGGDTPQEETGHDEPAHAAPDPQTAGSADSDSDAEEAQQTSSLSAPVPTEPASTPKLEVMTVDQAEDLAEANDIQACKDAARELRLAGVGMPPPLLALTALDLQYQQTESPAQ